MTSPTGSDATPIADRLSISIPSLAVLEAAGVPADAEVVTAATRLGEGGDRAAAGLRDGGGQRRDRTLQTVQRRRVQIRR